MNILVILAGDYNIIPTERDVYNPDRWRGRVANVVEIAGQQAPGM